MAIKDCIYKAIGRASIVLDYLYLRLFPRSSAQEAIPDTTGLTLDIVRPLDVSWNKDGVLYAEYGILTRSFWRAQEFSLFYRNSEILKRPLLDFGCGDGSFASVLFKEVDYGIDSNPQALGGAAKYGVYKKLLPDAESVGTESARTVISNSVLEHVKELDSALAEINRVLVPGGVFAFTVPVVKFKDDMTEYFGRWYSETINRLACHHNLLTPEQWKELLERHGFDVEAVKQYQPGRFTWWYAMMRFLGDKGLAVFWPGISKAVWRWFRPFIVKAVKTSIDETTSGANIFVIAKKQARSRPGNV